MKQKKLTIALPEDVWLRLQEEGQANGVSIGTHVKNLILNRDRGNQT